MSEDQAGSLIRVESFTSRLEARAPAVYRERSWATSDIQQGGHVAEVPAEATRTEHKLPLDDIATFFCTDTMLGLSSGKAQQRLQQDGPNVLSPPSRTPLFVKFLLQLCSGFAPILWAAAILCLAAFWPLGNQPPQTGDYLNLALSFVLIGVIVLQAAFNFYQEYKSDCIMDVLTSLVPRSCLALRGGEQVSLPVVDLVVGDVVIINGGDKVPADLRLISVKDLKLDKSTLNGESEPVKCTVQATSDNFMETRNLVFAGCSIVEGTGVGVVMKTGDETVFGDIAKVAGAQSTEPSTLQKEINHFVWIIAALSLSTGLIAFLGWYCWLRVDYPNFLSLSSQVVNCISLIVAFVPEGMPMAVTVTLALIAKDMSQSNVLVKNLGVVETLGSVSVIASDKTGTLTENRMTVSDLSHQGPTPAHKELMRAMALCNRAVPGANDSVIGDASDSALYRYCCQLAVSGIAPPPAATRETYAKLAELPFNSTNKYMLSIHEVPNEGHRLLLMKGAPEQMLSRCASLVDSSGAEVPLGDCDSAKVLREIESAAAKGQRILGFCRLRLPHDRYGGNFTFDVDEFNFPTTGLAFLGWVALRDPPRAGVKEAITQCRGAGIRVAMVTGDHPATARAIAQQVGIITALEVDDAKALVQGTCRPCERAIVLTGPDLESLSDEQWLTVCEYGQAVFARTTPKQKLQIVMAFQGRGECVAVTGDGVNDAPALKQANCGLAMGSGSEVSKEAADIVILDDNFASVVKGIEHGRRCFANLKKVVSYLLPAGSFAEMLPVLANVFLGMPLALSSFLMIVICCFTDVGPALAMVYEKPESGLMSMKPRGLGKDRLIDWKLLLNAYLFVGLIEASAAFATFFLFYANRGVSPSEVVFSWSVAGDPTEDPKGIYGEMAYTGQSLYFYALVVMQFANVLTSRTAILPISRSNPFCGPTRNLRIFAAIGVSAVLALMTLYLPFLQNSLQTRALPGDALVLTLPWICGMGLMSANEMRKGWALRYPGGIVAKLAWR